MHMSDALLSPVVGGVMWGLSAAAIGVSAVKLKKDEDMANVPLMGALGAFVFAAQMINFSIPGTGSSGHLGGAVLLAILLGPYAAFLVLVSILTVQALFFADGGILALGANIFNMGFYACFLAYPLLFRPIAGNGSSRFRVFSAAIIASIAGMTAGAFSVVLETVLSGISSLPFKPFAALMLPIHLAIGIVEGVVTGFIVLTLSRIDSGIPITGIVSDSSAPSRAGKQRKVLIIILSAAVLAGGLFSWFASTHPDGLEWSIDGVSGENSLTPASSRLQEKLSFLPDYGFRSRESNHSATTVSGLIGGAITLIFIFLIGYFLRKRTRRTSDHKGTHEGN